MKEITVCTPTATGKIYIGDDALEARLPLLVEGQKNFVVTDDNVYRLYPQFFKKFFSTAEIFVLPNGEENKNFQSLEKILTAMTKAGLHRTSKLFAVGGGVVGDIAGLASALYMRGISCVQIPTTLLSQVDSSVGGKTAVDLGGVKNVVGAFYQPCEVLIAPHFLKTLPQREIKCGLGEIVKYAALNGDIFDELQDNVNQLTNLQFLKRCIESCILHKKRVVEEDEKETGERKSLNVGHTTGHAIELSSALSHGECVLYGMFLETQVAIEAGVCEQEYGKKLLSIVKSAIEENPMEKFDFSCLSFCLEKAKSDKKNTEDDNIKMAVAKRKNEWVSYSLPFENYVLAIVKASKTLTR